MTQTMRNPLPALLVVLLAAAQPAAAQPAAAPLWSLGPPPPLPPLPATTQTTTTRTATRLQPWQSRSGARRWDVVAQRPRLRWERVPSHERILPGHTIPNDTLAIATGPDATELVQLDRPGLRWERVGATPQNRPLGPQAIRHPSMAGQTTSIPCSESLCGMRVTRRVWFRF